jgi:hypothetical protein
VKASLATVAIALLVLGAGCGGDDGGGDDASSQSTAASSAPSTEDSSAASTTAGTSTEDLASYETVTALNEALATWSTRA